MKTARARALSALLFSLVLTACSAPVSDLRLEEVEPALSEVSRSEDGVTLLLENPGSRSWSYPGYGKDAPLYSQELRRGESWEARPLGWCGTGLERQLIRPGERVSFPVFGQGEGAYRVVLTLTASDGSTRVVRSPAIEPLTGD